MTGKIHDTFKNGYERCYPDDQYGRVFPSLLIGQEDGETEWEVLDRADRLGFQHAHVQKTYDVAFKDEAPGLVPEICAISNVLMSLQDFQCSASRMMMQGAADGQEARNAMEIDSESRTEPVV